MRNIETVLLFADDMVVCLQNPGESMNMEAYSKVLSNIVLLWIFSQIALVNSLFWLFISSFQDFDIQGSRRCSLDWLTIETYKNIESYRACGSTVPPPYISSQDHIWIRFHSDDSISRKGFRLAYFSGVFLKKKNDNEQNSVLLSTKSLRGQSSKTISI